VRADHRALPLPAIRRERAAGDEAALLQRLDAVLEDSIAVHQRSDVPYGLFLSGGIDSAAVATVMARLEHPAGDRLHLRLRCARRPR
jgi:asparagine synthase (glutamine-hydrolysing)